MSTIDIYIDNYRTAHRVAADWVEMFDFLPTRTGLDAVLLNLINAHINMLQHAPRPIEDPDRVDFAEYRLDQVREELENVIVRLAGIYQLDLSLMQEREDGPRGRPDSTPDNGGPGITGEVLLDDFVRFWADE